MSFIAEAFFGGCISKVINDGKDYSWAKIKSVTNDKNDRNLSTRIYRVIEKALIKVTDKKFKGTDILYEAIEKIFIEFRDNGSTIESVKRGLGMLNSDVTVERCENFLEKFYDGVCQDEELHRRISLILQEKGIQINRKEFKQLNEAVGYGFDQLNRKIDNLADNTIENSLNNEEDETAKSIKFQNNKKQDYIKNWNSRLFLHIDNDENPITLADAFIIPDYEMHKSIKRIGFSDDDTFDQIIDKFIRYDRTSTMLITGVPGIGKSSITSWIANEYKDNENVIFLRFRDWSNKDLAEGLLNAIYNIFGCEKIDLENKVLIIDGFDEIKYGNERKSLIHEFFINILDFDNLKVIITSRPNYLNAYDFQNVFKILPFNISQIQEFFQIVKGSELDKRKIDCENLDVLGIPVILYMAIMSDIDLTIRTTRPELYTSIFAEKGGIFDRFCFGGIGYDNGAQALRTIENIRIYLNFLQQVAFSMFENDDLSLAKEKDDIPELEFQGQKLNVVEFPIKPFFETNGYNIEFIHRSIYEYFVSEYIFVLLLKTIEKNKDEMARVFGILLKRNILSEEILGFLNYKIRNSIIFKKFSFMYDTFQLMLYDGMTYYTKECYKNVIRCEMRVFANMLQILHVWNLEEVSFHSLNYYIKHNVFKLDLRGIELSKADLKGAELSGANLEKVNFKDANLIGANLQNANLKRGDLRGVKLQEANLRYADLRGADIRTAIVIDSDLSKAILTDAIIDENQAGYLRKKYDLQGTKVYIFKNKKTIRYNEFYDKMK